MTSHDMTSSNGIRAYRREIEQMTDAECDAAVAAARAACSDAWAAWEAVRDAGQTDLHCPEFQAHQRAHSLLSPLLGDLERRAFNRKLAMFAPPPMSGPENDRAWIDGPGSPAE